MCDCSSFRLRFRNCTCGPRPTLSRKPVRQPAGERTVSVLTVLMQGTGPTTRCGLAVRGIIGSSLAAAAVCIAGTRFAGTRFAGTRFAGTRFAGTRFAGAGHDRPDAL